MRDLTKSLRSLAKTAKAFDAVTAAARAEFEQPLQTLFGAGERLQSELIDLTFGPFSSMVDTIDTHAAPAPASPTGPPVQTKTAGGWAAMPLGPEPVGASCQPERISSDYSFAPHFVEVFGSRMHYVDEGKGEPVLLVHGNATWSYIWRNVIPHLTPYARCIAPDLIGFGRSNKPDIEYSWAEQADYVEEFIRKLGLRNITLVLNDFGISLCMRYAMRHEQNVKGMAFFEGVFKTFASLEEAYSADFRPLFKRFRTGGKGGEGYQLLVDQNFFIEQMLPRAAGREFTAEELQRYREPFTDVCSRIPIWQFARCVPIAGEPKDVWATMTDAVAWFKETKLPKLLFYGTPGGLVTAEFVEWCRQNLKNLKVVHVGPGVHYLTESSPHVIGRELVQWLGELSEPHGRRGPE
ncbi:MAG TPA: haloalkane dehalogenase [Pyrinomonadaceae bacterium]